MAVLVTACGGSGETGSELNAPQWTLVGPEVRIGSVDDSAYAFRQVLALAVGPDSCLYSTHRGEPMVRKWTWDGRPAGHIGRGGEGPGEFAAPWEIGFFGDTLWVMDPNRFHASFFSTDGKYLGMAAPRVDIGGRGMTRDPPLPERPLRDGTWVGAKPAFSEPIARGTLTDAPYVHMDSAGAVLDTIWIHPLRRTDVLALLRPSGGGGMFTQQPFGDAPQWQVLDDGSMVVMSDRVPGKAEGAFFTVMRLNASGDTTWRVAIPYTPTPMPSSRIDSAAAAIANRIAPYMKQEGMGTEGSLEKRLRGALYAPPFVPFLQGRVVSSNGALLNGMVVAADGSVWLRRSEVTRKGAEWWVLDPRGQPTGRVEAPAGLRVVLVRGNHLWGVETDDMGVNYIVRYRIDRGSAPRRPEAEPRS
jgi:hypothetical protein